MRRTTMKPMRAWTLLLAFCLAAAARPLRADTPDGEDLPEPPSFEAQPGEGQDRHDPKHWEEAADKIIEKCLYRDGVRCYVEERDVGDPERESVLNSVRKGRDGKDCDRTCLNGVIGKLFSGLAARSTPNNNLGLRFATAVLSLEGSAQAEAENDRYRAIRQWWNVRWDRAVDSGTFLAVIRHYVGCAGGGCGETRDHVALDAVPRLVAGYLSGRGAPAAALAGALRLLNEDGVQRWKRAQSDILAGLLPEGESNLRLASPEAAYALLEQLNGDNDPGGAYRRRVEKLRQQWKPKSGTAKQGE